MERKACVALQKQLSVKSVALYSCIVILICSGGNEVKEDSFLLPWNNIKALITARLPNIDFLNKKKYDKYDETFVHIVTTGPRHIEIWKQSPYFNNKKYERQW